MTTDQLCLIALGANLPSNGRQPEIVLPAALDAIADEGVRVTARSRLFRTPCFPVGAGPDYVNAAAVLHSDLAPGDLLALLHRVETQFGREREVRWGMRTLDLDLLAMGDQVVPDRTVLGQWMDLPPEDQVRQAPDRLILPHPRLQDRAFVLVPLNDVAPDWRHPVLGRTVAQMCADLPPETRAEVVPIEHVQ